MIYLFEQQALMNVTCAQHSRPPQNSKVNRLYKHVEEAVGGLEENDEKFQEMRLMLWSNIIPDIYV